jgi:hypothetical protein
MDDFTPSGLHESKNEWGARLITILTPHVIEGFRSILDESIKLCKNNDEMEKYLMTFQNFISRIPKWSNEIVDAETKRIIDKSGCPYLEDLITCVHVIQLKILTSVRVGQKAKKVDMDIMGINDFIHKVYINTARQFYRNVYLFDSQISPLQKQKNNRELETITQECILNTVRESIPVQTILKCYLDETTEEDIQEEIKEEDITPDPVNTDEPQYGGSDVTTNEENENIKVETEEPMNIDNTEIEKSPSTLSFNDVDTAVDTDKNEYTISAPKDVERLEEISKVRNETRKQEEEDDDEEDKIKILGDPISLDSLDVHDIEIPSLSLDLDPLMDVEILA